MRSAAKVLAAGLLAGAFFAGSSSAASATEPKLTVKRAAMAAAITCHGKIGPRKPGPLIFAPGTGSSGSQVYLLGKRAFEVIGRPLCTVSFPDRTTADMQVSVQYLVYAIRVLSRKAAGPVAVAGVSQGGLLARVALTYWPSLRRAVSDVVTAAATHHGAVGTPEGAATCLQVGCPPAIWQQASGSNFLRVLNGSGDETPGRTAYTTVRSATDEVVQPQTGAAPTSALEGASNILIQAVCPGRVTTHIGTAVDSVTIAALHDAVTHRGPAKVSRFPVDVCAHPYGTGLDEQQTSFFLTIAAQLIGQGGAPVPVVREEPTLRAWVKRRR